MNEWMNECMNAWMNEQISEWFNLQISIGRTVEWINERVCELKLPLKDFWIENIN